MDIFFNFPSKGQGPVSLREYELGQHEFLVYCIVLQEFTEYFYRRVVKWAQGLSQA